MVSISKLQVLTATVANDTDTILTKQYEQTQWQQTSVVIGTYLRLPRGTVFAAVLIDHNTNETTTDWPGLNAKQVR